MSKFKEEAVEDEFLEETFGDPIDEPIEAEAIEVSEEDDFAEEEALEEVEHSEEEADEEEKPKKKKKPKKAKGGGKTVLIAIIAVVLLIVGGMGFFVYGIYSDVSKTVNATPSAPIVQAPQIGSGSGSASPSDPYGVNGGGVSVQTPPPTQGSIPPSSVESSSPDAPPPTAYGKEQGNPYGVSTDTTMGTPPVSTPLSADDASNPYYKETQSPSTSSPDSLTGVETEMMGISSSDKGNIKNGGVCELSVKYTPNKEYVYYVQKGDIFIPVFKTKGWDEKGIVVKSKVIAESYAPIEKFVEVEDGKILPSEMFSKCEPF